MSDLIPVFVRRADVGLLMRKLKQRFVGAGGVRVTETPDQVTIDVSNIRYRGGESGGQAYPLTVVQVARNGGSVGGAGQTATLTYDVWPVSADMMVDTPLYELVPVITPRLPGIEYVPGPDGTLGELYVTFDELGDPVPRLVRVWEERPLTEECAQ